MVGGRRHRPPDRERQRAQPLPGQREKGVGDGRRGRRHAELGDAARRLVAFEQLDADLGRVAQDRQAVGADRPRASAMPLVDLDRLAGRGGDAVDDAALDLLLDDLGIDHPAAIDRADRAQHAQPLVAGHLDLDQAGDVRAEGAVAGDAHAAARRAAVPAADRGRRWRGTRARRGLSPSICIRKDSGSMPGGAGQLVDEAFGEEAGVAVRARRARCRSRCRSRPATWSIATLAMRIRRHRAGDRGRRRAGRSRAPAPQPRARPRRRWSGAAIRACQPAIRPCATQARHLRRAPAGRKRVALDLLDARPGELDRPAEP